MAGRERGRGWLLLIAGVCALMAGVLARLVRRALHEAARGETVTVWVTPSGTHYHRRDCVALSRSTPARVALSAARDDGLTPCELCEPPV